MAIYRGVVRNGLVMPEGTLPLPEGTLVQIVPEGTALPEWEGAFEQLNQIAHAIALTAPPTLNLGKLVEEAREELEGND